MSDVMSDVMLDVISVVISFVEIDNQTIKCNKCEFIAESDDGLKVHTKTKHTEQNKLKLIK